MLEQIFAQSETRLGTIGGPGLGPFATNIPTTGADALNNVTRGVSALIGLMTIMAGIWFLFQFIVGGFYWITSTGDKAKLEAARHRINDALVGLVIVVTGWAVLALASQFLGVDFLGTDPTVLINQLNIRN